MELLIAFSALIVFMIIVMGIGTLVWKLWSRVEEKNPCFDKDLFEKTNKEVFKDLY